MLPCVVGARTMTRLELDAHDHELRPMMSKDLAAHAFAGHVPGDVRRMHKGLAAAHDLTHRPPRELAHR